MEKIKWHYDKKHKQWWTEGTHSDSSPDGFSINKLDKKVFAKNYQLTMGHFKHYHFLKLSSAKLFAQLLRHG